MAKHLVGLEFLEQTKHKNQMEASEQQQGVSAPLLQVPFEGKLIALPDPGGAAEVAPRSFKALADGRTSVRDYAIDPISMEELSYLFWCTQGVKETGRIHSFRTVPSAGARHAFETYLLVNDVEGLKPGLYRYLSINGQLGVVYEGHDLLVPIMQACFNQGFIADCAAVFIWAATARRMTWRYGQRGFRYLYLDAGHVCQNLYLASEAIGCGTCAIAAFDDDEMNRLLGLDGEEQFTIYLATVGRKKR